MSIFLGDELNGVLEAIETGTPYAGAEKTQMKLGVNVLPKFNRDTTDRNRTSPFAFTGNKFEFRMLGSSNSIACANIMLNSAVAECLKLYADRLEKAGILRLRFMKRSVRPSGITNGSFLMGMAMTTHG